MRGSKAMAISPQQLAKRLNKSESAIAALVEAALTVELETLFDHLEQELPPDSYRQFLAACARIADQQQN